MKILVSAGEASGDRYGAELVAALRKRLPEADFFGCGGRYLRKEGLRAVIRAEDLAVVGLFEVARHIPRIYRRFRQFVAAVRAEKPQLAILIDAPDFHLRLAKKLRRLKIPIAYYVAPQAWAWRKGRVKTLRRLIDRLLVIFPFEEEFFFERGVKTTFVGHPLAGRVRVSTDRGTFFREHGLDPQKRLIALLPGSRRGESLRHLPALEKAAAILSKRGGIQLILPASATTGRDFFAQRWRGPEVVIVEEQTQDAVGHADLALVASGTATVETALLGTPMVTFYRLAWPSYWLAKMLVHAPFYSMVNLLAGRKVVPELIQRDCTGGKLAAESVRLLLQEPARRRMVEELAEIEGKLHAGVPAAERAAEAICEQYSLQSV